MSKSNNLTDFLTDLADGIRTKKGYSSATKINPQNFRSEVESIPSGKPETATTVTLNLASGNQVVTPSTGQVFSQVTITKPSTLLASNIKKDINIAGVVGTFEGGGGGGATVVTATNVSATSLTFAGTSSYTHFVITAVSNTGYAAASQVYGIYSFARYDNSYRAVYYMSYGGAKFNFTKNSSPDEVKRSGDNFTINSTYASLGLGWITNASQVTYVGLFW